MQLSSRRDFVIGSAAGLTALGAGMLPAAEAAADNQMVIAKWSGQESLNNDQINQAAGKMAEKAIEALGGMGRFVKRGDVVWVKPNIGWDRTPETAANTNPEIVGAIVKMCLDAGAKTVKVGDFPVHNARKSYASSGIAAATEAAGGKVVYLDETRFRNMDIKGEKVKLHPVYPEIIESDVVINIPVVKHHVLAKLTMCMKNYMGVIDKRREFHQDLPTCITDLTRFMQPRAKLQLLDGVRILTAHGPTGGNLADVKTTMTLAAGTDIVAIDAWGSELIGQKIDDIGTVVKADKSGLGTKDYRKLNPKEISVA